MKKLWYASVILIPLLLFALFSGCSSKGGGCANSFTYDGQNTALVGAGVEHLTDNGDQWFEISIVSSGIDVPEWTGTGGYLLYQAAISYDYVADTDSGTWIEADWGLASSGDYIKISASGDTYTFEFSLTMEDGKTVTGCYTGSLTVWS